jgi:cytochrome c oxidase cbb3-type subunit 3
MLENGSPNNPTMRPFIKEGTITGRDAEKLQLGVSYQSGNRSHHSSKEEPLHKAKK